MAVVCDICGKLASKQVVVDFSASPIVMAGGTPSTVARTHENCGTPFAKDVCGDCLRPFLSNARTALYTIVKQLAQARKNEQQLATNAAPYRNNIQPM